MNANQKTINFTGPLFFLAVLGLVGTIIGYGLHYFHTQRQIQIRDKYYSETQSYITRNQQGLEAVFNEVFDNNYCRNTSDPNCQKPRHELIQSLITDDLTDFSSTVFVKRYTDGKIMVMKLSGEIEMLHTWPEQTLVAELLRGERADVPWGEYYWGFPNKEVIVPFKDSSGKVLGGIMRGVIEN